MTYTGSFAVAGKDEFRVSAPTVTINSTTNFNQNRATFNATVSSNGATTSVKFQYKKTADSTWTDGETITGVSGANQTVYSNQTGLEENASSGTPYDVRAIATNSAGSTTSSTTSFTTWKRYTYELLSSGSGSVTIQTITPTGSSAIVPTIYEVFIAGGGGGGGYAGGGAGGYVKRSSYSLNNATNLTISTAAGAGGGAQSNGGSSSISGSGITTLTAGGGGAGLAGTGASANSGGNTGSGDVAYTGGSRLCGYNYGGKSGSYEDCNYWGSGGGAAWSGNGYSATTPETGFYFTQIVGGDGRTGETHYGYYGGEGGRAYGTYAYGASVSPNGYGSGGDAINGSGTGGMVSFKYWGPV
jgi:hypothetical protein